MSITISNCTQICNSPTNTSKSKMLYTFTKQPRCKNHKNLICDQFYDLKNIKETRSTGIGYGNKSDFTKLNTLSPSPNTYHLKSDFQQDQKKGFKFGIGRQQMAITGPFRKSANQKNPGPSTYSLQNIFKQSISYSMRSKNLHEISHHQLVPGPGHYPVTFAINDKGNYFLSKYKSSYCSSFNTLGGRAKLPVNKVPGPGAYSIDKTSISPQGKYALSRMQNSQTSKFPKNTRIRLERKTDTPGPGNYKLPSQFGHYLSKHAIKKSSINSSFDKENKI